jgi:hypothetical protein
VLDELEQAHEDHANVILNFDVMDKDLLIDDTIGRKKLELTKRIIGEMDGQEVQHAFTLSDVEHGVLYVTLRIDDFPSYTKYAK